ncbi:MAG TPA: ABC-2 family transporter protein, partial [Thermoanaerobaculia bacterium]|nr:ABC-2 family transporter protein [Thermoanaerobaculia bacterium]
MASFSRYPRLLALQARASLLVALQYRLDFFLSFSLGVFWSLSALVPLLVLFQIREGVAGWTWPEALLVASFFLMVKSVLSTVIQPSAVAAVEQIRLGTLDFVLLKPADSQFLVTTSRLELARSSDFLAGFALMVVALVQRGEPVTAAGIMTATWLFASGVLILYSLFVIVLSMAFLFVKIDNLSYLMSSIFDAARWPASVFRGALALLFTFVVPLAVMTTYPALALLGRAGPARVALATGITAAFLALS